MIFNGHTLESVNAINEATMGEIMIMYSDGMLSNKNALEMLGLLVTGVFNYIRTPHSAPYTLKGILGNAYGYIYADAEVSPNDSLLTFMTQAQGFQMDKFKKG